MRHKMFFLAVVAGLLSCKHSPETQGSFKAASSGLVLVRPWTRPSSEGQRVRLYAGANGSLMVAYGQHQGGRQWKAILEDAAGAVLDTRPFTAENAKFHPVKSDGSSLLYRHNEELHLGSDLIAAGAFESYTGMEALVVAWKPRAGPRPHPATVIRRSIVPGWISTPWPVEAFGLDFARVATGTVAIATRDSGASAGATLRLADEDALRSAGTVVERGKWVWRPPAGLSLEDCTVVRGAAVPSIVAEAYDTRVGPLCPNGKPCGGPSGRVFFAEAGGPLREILQAAPTVGNSEVWGVVWQGALHVAAEPMAGRSGLYRYDGRSMVLVGYVEGGWPALAMADGKLYMSSERGLWRWEL